MNYYPYYNFYPNMVNIASQPRVGLISKLLGGRNIGWASILGNTQKVLNVANQAIPLVKQATPVVKNAKTMLKVMNEFKRVDTPKTNKVNTEKAYKSDSTPIVNNVSSDSFPTFFV